MTTTYTRENVMVQEQTLSSYVINTPYIFDSRTTAPKVDKLHALPLGLRLTSTAIIRLSLKFGFCSILGLITSSFILTSILLPLNLENEKLLSYSRTLANQQLALRSKSQKAASYERLFRRADTLNFQDAKEVIHINKADIAYSTSSKKPTNNYHPSYSGF